MPKAVEKTHDKHEPSGNRSPANGQPERAFLRQLNIPL
jgi:hypothetical protein